MTPKDLKPFEVFSELSDGECETLLGFLENRDLSHGETLFAEGDEAESLVLIVRGELGLTDPTGERGVLYSGESFGEFALFSFGQRALTATSRGKSEVWLLRREDFRRLIDDYPRTAFRIAERVLEETADRVRAAFGSA